MILNFIDEVLAGVPKFTITHQDNSTEEVSIDLTTTVTTEGTPLNKVLFDKIDKYLVPTGVITMWSGSINNIPVGWALCNGQNGTPDLRNRFIVGAGDEYQVGATGGEKTHTLTVNELPAHSHDIKQFPTGQGSTTRQGFATSQGSTTTKETENAGGGQGHENRPPYYALAYIMKLSN